MFAAKLVMNLIVLVLQLVVRRVVETPLLLWSQIAVLQTLVQRLMLLAQLFMGFVVLVLELFVQRIVPAVRILGIVLILMSQSSGRDCQNHGARKHQHT